MVNPAPLPDWLRALYPFEPQTHATAAGARLSYVDEGPRLRSGAAKATAGTAGSGGQGRTSDAVVFLHGNPTWSFYYRRLISALADRRRCIAPDHIGMGLSEKPPGHDYTLAGRIADLAGLIDRLGLERVDLVMHDWGGAIGCGWAVEHERRVGRMVLLNTAAFPSRRIPWRISLCRWPFLGAVLVRRFNGFAAPATRMAMRQRRLSREERRAYLYPYDSWSHRIGVHRFVRDIPMELHHPTRPVIERIARELPRLALKPKFIGWGGRDFCFDDHFLARWRSVYPQAEALYLPQAGHFVLEDAGPELIPRIRDFLS